MKKLLVKLIEIYQRYLSFDNGLLHLFAPNGACRFEVHCSEYTKQAIIKYGVLKGSMLGIKRILRCNPFTSFEEILKGELI